YGFSLAEIERWGGTILRCNRPGSKERKEHILSGSATAVFDEGLKSWGAAALESGMRFLPIREDVLRKLERMGFPRSLVTKAHYPTIEKEIPTLDYSGWTFFCHRELSDKIAYAMAEAIDLSHARIPVDHFERRPMTMEEFCRGGDGGPLIIPLHPGAKKYYQEKGYL
ncbi:MAG: TAXI family TRAP transporter solute-binding subunit, partial [Candidatus Binatia bacterium]